MFSFSASNRALTRQHKAYQKAESYNGYLISLGGGVMPFPSFEKWLRFNRDELAASRSED